MKLEKPIALCNPKRTGFAQIGKALADKPAHELGQLVAEDIIKSSGLDKNKIDGVIVGEGTPQAPNSARVIANMIGLPNEINAVTINQNCVSSLEAVADAARRIMIGEGSTYLVIGEESQSSAPFIVKNARINKKTGNVDKLTKALQAGELPEGVEIRDTLEDGLGDGPTSYGMPVTAEIVAQNYGLTRETSDKVAYESFKRALAATEGGKYSDYITSVKTSAGEDFAEDEAVLLRKGIVENPERMDKAMLLFDNKFFSFDDFKKKYGESIEKSHGPTVTIFNACARSDGASGVIVTTPEEAEANGLEVVAYLTGWSFKGVHPNNMGIGQAEASIQLMEDLGKKPEDVDIIEIHEAFAATAIGALEEIKKRTGFDWEKNFDAGKINPNGGSIAVGHPFGATGIRLVINAALDIKEDSSVNSVLTTACAHGGVAGALMIERAK